MGEFTHVLQKCADIFWMIFYLAGGFAAIGEMMVSSTLSTRIAFLSSGLLLLSFGIFGRAYPNIVKDELDLLPE